MDILSILPIIIIIFAVVFNLKKGNGKTAQHPRNPYSPSSTWAHNLENSLQKWLSYEGPTSTPKVEEDRKTYSEEETSWMNDSPETEGTEGIEGTAGVEGTAGMEGGTFKSMISYETETLQREECSCIPDLSEKDLTEAVIWAEILGKPKARITRPFRRNY